ncbi:MAG: S41 family peptidase [Hyphomicrobiaceae bacterium]
MLNMACTRAVVALLITALVGVGSASTVSAESSARRAHELQQRVDPLTRRLEVMLRAMRIARDWHVAAPNRQVLIAGAIEGLLARVDPEAELYTRSDLRRIARFAPTAAAGLGLELRREPPQRRLGRPGYRVVAAADRSPAAVAGLKPGDLVTRIDGRPAGDIPYLVLTRVLLQGAPGSSVRLTVERTGDVDASEDVVLERAALEPPAVSVDQVAPGVTRIRLATITDGTAAEIARALRVAPPAAAEASPAAAARGIVLDLRSTSAATLSGARDVADSFLESGPILRMVSRRSATGQLESATRGDLAAGRPVVVLVDGGTAGAVEMLVAGLQEGHRARVVGTNTAGRGALRTLVPVESSAQKGLLRMTTARLLTPAGAQLEGKGITPDFVVDQLPAEPRCRSLDMRDAAAPGRCRPRTVAQDAQLQRAIALVEEPLVAAKQAPVTAKP